MLATRAESTPAYCAFHSSVSPQVELMLYLTGWPYFEQTHRFVVSVPPGSIKGRPLFPPLHFVRKAARGLASVIYTDDLVCGGGLTTPHRCSALVRYVE